MWWICISELISAVWRFSFEDRKPGSLRLVLKVWKCCDQEYIHFSPSQLHFCGYCLCCHCFINHKCCCMSAVSHWCPLQQAFCHLKLFIYSGLMIQPFVPQCIALVCHELGQVNKCFLTVSLSKLSRSGFWGSDEEKRDGGSGQPEEHCDTRLWQRCIL